MTRPHVPPARGWRSRAACRLTVSGVDLVLIEDRPDALDPDDPAGRLSTPAEVAIARAVCRRCPVAGDCLAAALGGLEVAGMAGGRTPAERDQLRAEHELQPRVEVTVHDLVTESEWTVDLFAELDEPPGPGAAPVEIPPAMIRVVVAMSAAGLSKAEIAARLDGVRGRRVTARTVDYCRRLATGNRTRSAS